MEDGLITSELNESITNFDEAYPGLLTVVSYSQIVEFVKDPEHPVAASTLPVSSDEIVAYSKKRNPFRHPSMVFKKSKAMEAGNYSGEFLYFEDWDLFNRMLAIGCKAWNIDHPLRRLLWPPWWTGLSAAYLEVQDCTAQTRIFHLW